MFSGASSGFSAKRILKRCAPAALTFSSSEYTRASLSSALCKTSALMMCTGKSRFLYCVTSVTGTEIFCCAGSAASSPAFSALSAACTFSAFGACASGSCSPEAMSMPSSACGSSSGSGPLLEISLNAISGASLSSVFGAAAACCSAFCTCAVCFAAFSACTDSRMRRTESSLTSGTTFACCKPNVSFSRSSLISIVCVCASCSIAVWKFCTLSFVFLFSGTTAFGSFIATETGTGATMPSSSSTAERSTPAVSTASATRRRRSFCRRSKSFATSSSSSAVFSSNSLRYPSSCVEISPVASNPRVYSSIGFNWMP